MGFMDELKKLTQPYDDEDDFYEDASEAFIPKEEKKSERPQQSTSKTASENFEDSFSADPPSSEVVKKKSRKSKVTNGAGGSIFGNLGDDSPQEVSQRPAQRPQQNPKQAQRPQKKRVAAGTEQQVVLFNPKDFDEAGDLVTYISQGRSLVMALEDIPTDTARRLLDFISGICFAMNAKITPVSTKTYFITPENVNLLDAAALQKDVSEPQDEF